MTVILLAVATPNDCLITIDPQPAKGKPTADRTDVRRQVVFSTHIVLYLNRNLVP